MPKISDTPKPWYREPWPWILMAGPAVAIVGCAITMYLAVTRYKGEAMTDDAIQRGLVVQRLPDAAPPAPAPTSRQP